jgi:hypothetical protein
VQVVEVDMVGAQPFERAGDRGAHGPCTPVSDGAPPPELRREDDLLATPLEDLAEEALAVAAAVRLGRVEEADARVDRGIDDGASRFEVDASTEVVASEADPRDAKVAPTEPNLLHGRNAIRPTPTLRAAIPRPGDDQAPPSDRG